MSHLLEGFVFSVNIIGPMLLLLCLGYWLGQSGRLTQELVSGLNTLVFHYSLPAMLFFAVVRSSVSLGSQWLFVLVGIVAVLLLYLIGCALGSRFFASSERGVFVQGIFRSNLAVVGLALCKNIYTDDVLGIAALFCAAVALFLNVMGVITLTQFTESSTGFSFSLLLHILKNPLILGILLALPFKSFSIELPFVVHRFGHYLSELALPLAMLCAGASFRIKGLLLHRGVAVWGSLGKMLLAPAVFVLMGILFGFEGTYLGILFLMGAAPAATAGYIMATVMPGNNPSVAANIVALTNLGSLFVIGFVLPFFRVWGWQ